MCEIASIHTLKFGHQGLEDQIELINKLRGKQEIGGLTWSSY